MQLNYPEVSEVSEQVDQDIYEQHPRGDDEEGEQTPAQRLEADMQNGEVVGDFPENFSAEPESPTGEEKKVLEMESQMEEAVRAGVGQGILLM